MASGSQLSTQGLLAVGGGLEGGKQTGGAGCVYL